jgi:hypothetical protein
MQRILLILAAIIFWFQLVNSSSAQSNAPTQGSVRVPVPVSPNEPYPPGAQRIFEWSYVCADKAGAGCRVDCFASDRSAPTLSVTHALNVQMYLIGISVGKSVVATTFIFYTDADTGNNMQGSAYFLNPSGCHVQGMNLSSSGLPK